MKTVIIWLAAVLVVSLYPDVRVRFYGADKGLHFIIYAITCALFFVVLRDRMRGRFWWALALAVVLSSAYGLLMEVAQGLTKVRHFSKWDALANSLGALATAAFLAVKRKTVGG